MVGRRLRQLTYDLRLGPFRETYARSGNYQRGGFAILSVTAAELQGCEPGIETGALREVRMQTCSTLRPFCMMTIRSAFCTVASR